MLLILTWHSYHITSSGSEIQSLYSREPRIKSFVTLAVVAIAVVVVFEIKDIKPSINVAREKAGGQGMPVVGSYYLHLTSNTVCVPKAHSRS